ncbi:abscisic acid receptor PYR1-like isoform X2 [Papaver somniferum]|uniref:abscisic acid receptor PYR1-like isoform X2 n=1 Tax=Papaver somniferum TaxID=3469 RepID=UPI000E701C6B|nr:abscisic acid receptor PYR1-like isoform X2 [Papaver somniferum]
MADSATIPAGLTREEFQVLEPVINEYHSTYTEGAGNCSSILSQRINAPLSTVWKVVRRFDKPQIYKHFIKSCNLKQDDSSSSSPNSNTLSVGCLREVNVISGLPAETSTERLDILDDDRHVTGFSIIGGEHRLRNYRSITTVNEFKSHDQKKIWTIVLESYAVDVPEGNTDEDTRMFADTVVRLNLQKLASLTEGIARDGDRGRTRRWSLTKKRPL